MPEDGAPIGQGWWRVEPPPDSGRDATDRQKKFVEQLARRGFLERVLTREEKCLIELQGVDDWFSSLTFDQARAYINRCVRLEKDDEEEAKKRLLLDKEAAKAEGLPIEKVIGRCMACGGFLVLEDETVYACNRCSARGFACRRGR